MTASESPWVVALPALGSIAGPAVAIVALVVTSRTTRLGFQQQRHQAVEQRLWDTRADLYMSVLAFLRDLELYSIERCNDACNSAFDPAGHSDIHKDRPPDEEYPAYPEAPAGLLERLGLFGSFEVDRLVSIATSACGLMRFRDFSAERGPAADYERDMDSLRDLVLETARQAGERMRTELQDPGAESVVRSYAGPHPGVGRVHYVASWNEATIVDAGTVLWRGFVTGSSPPGAAAGVGSPT